MRKRFLFCVLVCLLAVITMGVVGCVVREDPPKDNNIPNKDSFYTDGFTKGSATLSNMVTDLVCSTFNTINPLTINDKTGGNRSVHSSISLEVNNVIKEIDFRLNYSYDSPNDTVMNVEVKKPSSNDILLGLYFFKGENTSDIYIKLEDNKIFTNVQAASVAKTLPIAYQEGLKNEVISALARLVILDGDIKYEYRTTGSEGVIRHYHAKIDLVKSMENVMVLGKIFNYDITNLDYIFRNLFGTSLDTDSVKRFPKTYVEVEFTTMHGGSQIFDKGVIANAELKIDVARSTNASTVFEGEPYKASLKVLGIQVNKNYLTNIKSKSDLVGYTKYDNAFRLEGEIVYVTEPSPYSFRADIRYDSEHPSNSEFIINIKDPLLHDYFVLHYKEENLRLMVRENGEEREVTFRLDYQTFMSSFFELFNNREVGFVENLVYILGSLGLKDSKLSYNYNMNNLLKVIGFDINGLMAMLNSASENKDIEAILDEGGINLEKFLKQNFMLIMDTSKVLITPIDKVGE